MGIQKVQMRRLKNGVPVYFQPDKSSHVVSIAVKAGAAYDPENFIGCAHAYEHCASSETKSYSGEEINRLLRAYSAHYHREAGIFTDHMSTAYGCGFLRRRDYIFNLFPMFAEMVTSPVITKKTLEIIEKGAILCEWAKHGEDDIEDRILRKLLRMIYPENPISRRIDCELGHLMGGNTLVELLKFKEKYYVSSNIAVIILGPDRKKAMNMAIRVVGDMPQKSAPRLIIGRDKTFPRLSQRLFSEFVYGDDETKTFHLVMGFPTEPYGSPHDDAFDVLAELFEMHIEEIMRDQAPSAELGTYHPEVRAERTKLHGIIRVSVPCVSIAGAERAENVILEELNKIQNGRFLDFGHENLQRKTELTQKREAALKVLKRLKNPTDLARRPILDSYTEAFVNSPNVLAELIIESFANGDGSPARLNDFNKRLRKVTKNKIMEAARQLSAEGYACVRAVPRNPLDFRRFKRA